MWNWVYSILGTWVVGLNWGMGREKATKPTFHLTPIARSMLWDDPFALWTLDALGDTAESLYPSAGSVENATATDALTFAPCSWNRTTHCATKAMMVGDGVYGGTSSARFVDSGLVSFPEDNRLIPWADGVNTGNVTIEFLINREDLQMGSGTSIYRPPGGVPVFILFSNPGCFVVQFHLDVEDKYGHVYRDRSCGTMACSSGLALHRWHHVLFTFREEDGMPQVYLDGQLGVGWNPAPDRHCQCEANFTEGGACAYGMKRAIWRPSPKGSESGYYMGPGVDTFGRMAYWGIFPGSRRRRIAPHAETDLPPIQGGAYVHQATSGTGYFGGRDSVFVRCDLDDYIVVGAPISRVWLVAWSGPTWESTRIETDDVVFEEQLEWTPSYLEGQGRDRIPKCVPAPSNWKKLATARATLYLALSGDPSKVTPNSDAAHQLEEDLERDLFDLLPFVDESTLSVLVVSGGSGGRDPQYIWVEVEIVPSSHTDSVLWSSAVAAQAIVDLVATRKVALMGVQASNIVPIRPTIVLRYPCGNGVWANQCPISELAYAVVTIFFSSSFSAVFGYALFEMGVCSRCSSKIHPTEIDLPENSTTAVTPHSINSDRVLDQKNSDFRWVRIAFAIAAALSASTLVSSVLAGVNLILESLNIYGSLVLVSACFVVLANILALVLRCRQPQPMMTGSFTYTINTLSIFTSPAIVATQIRSSNVNSASYERSIAISTAFTSTPFAVVFIVLLIRISTHPVPSSDDLNLNLTTAIAALALFFCAYASAILAYLSNPNRQQNGCLPSSPSTPTRSQALTMALLQADQLYSTPPSSQQQPHHPKNKFALEEEQEFE